MLPVAMIVGGAGYEFFERLSPLTPYLIFTMLLITYCRVSWREIRILPLHLWMLVLQIAGAAAVYAALLPLGPSVSQGVFICVLAPTATSAAVVTGMLGGSVASLATYCLLSNMVVALISPVVFSFVGSQVSLPLLDSLLRIGRQMIPLLILPFVAALALQRFWPRAHRALRQRQSISFYLWAVSLTIVMGNTTSFLIRQDSSRYGDELLLAGASLVACVCQFVIGRRIGRKYDLKISGAQGLGQKNTVLAIWMAQTYLLPIASVGPAAYVVWQNVINSWQLWKKRRSEAEQQI